MKEMNRRIALAGIVTSFSAACIPSGRASKGASINEIYDDFSDRLGDIVRFEENFEVLGQDYGWSEGPAWDRKRNQLYFTDVPGNKAYVWKRGQGVAVFLDPSGDEVQEGFREPGANGLFYLRDDSLLLCNHGKRSVENFNIESGRRDTLANRFQGMRFNSPNDIIASAVGEIYFTDPPYGLEGLDNSPLKEMGVNGVYKIDKMGGVTRLIAGLTRPNGVALSPNDRYLFVTNSDPEAIHIYRLDLKDMSKPPILFVDLSVYADDDSPGLPDGMAVDMNGNIFATGPGGVFIISPDGEVLGRIKTGKASANCCFGEDGNTLFITNHDRLLRLKVKTKGVAWRA